MGQHRSVIIGASAILLALVTGCDDSGGSTRFRGTYEVPVSADLAAAATYEVPEIEWRVDGDEATLKYDLPMGLVGKKVRVEFTGALGASGTAGTLDGSPGTAKCAVSSASVVCNEAMSGLLPLEPDLSVVEALAKKEYAGPTADRIDVAKRFVADPIGIVHVDLSAPLDGEVETEKD